MSLCLYLFIPYRDCCAKSDLLSKVVSDDVKHCTQRSLCEFERPDVPDKVTHSRAHVGELGWRVLIDFW